MRFKGGDRVKVVKTGAVGFVSSTEHPFYRVEFVDGSILQHIQELELCNIEEDIIKDNSILIETSLGGYYNPQTTDIA